MPVIRLRVADRTSLAERLRDLWDDKAGPCTVEVYSGAMPAGPHAATAGQVRLGTLVCSDPVGSVANGTLTFSSISEDVQADESGQASWARLFDGSGFARADFDVTDMEGNGTIRMNSTAIVKDGPIRLDSFVIVMGGG
jgi:hypothetical protein